MKHSHIFIRFPEGKYKAVTFSFDDGSFQDKWVVKQLIDRKMKGTFNLNMGLLPPDRNFDFDTLDINIFPVKEWQKRLCLDEIKELFLGSGMELATHGFLHAQLPFLDEDTAIYELMRDRKALEDIVGMPVRGHAYAQGACNDRVYPLLRKAGLVYGRMVGDSNCFYTPTHPDDFLRWYYTCGFSSGNLFDLIDKFVAAKHGGGIYLDEIYAKLFNFFGHSYELDTEPGLYDRMEKIFDKLCGHDDVWYCTYMEYYRYATAFYNLDFNLDRDVVYNPSAIPVWIFANGKTVCINPDEYVNL